MTRLPPPPAVWGAPVAAQPPQEELKALLRMQRPPPHPPLTHLHLLRPLCLPPPLSSHCPPCRRWGRVRSQMSQSRRIGFKEERHFPSFDNTPSPQRQLWSGWRSWADLQPSQTFGSQRASSIELMKLVVQDSFFSTLMTVSLFHSLKSQVPSCVF